MADMQNPSHRNAPSRRTLIASGLAFAGTTAFASPVAQLTLHSERVLNTIPADYCGFSAELALLSDPAYYEPRNASLVALHRRLSPHGVLRLGGNTSEVCYWKATPDTAPPPIRIPGQGRADNTMPQHFTALTPDAITNLRAFLDASGWTCIYGLNLGTGTPERDALEAAFVAQTLESRLQYFEIGNEPDLYVRPNNLLRPAGWGFDDYMREWSAIAHAVSARVPSAKFAGPGATTNPEWVTRFAREAPRTLGPQIIGLTGHYYASGPPDSPAVNITNLLKPDPVVARRMDAIMPAARAAGLAFRITEANSCYRGGKPDMSNALASALWGADYMLDIAARGGVGVNFHGGLGKQIAASVGDVLPGVRNAADQEFARLGTFYSPWAGNRSEGFSARPLFYGMMLVEQFAQADLVATTFDTLGANTTAYAAKAADGFRIALINKEAERNITVHIDLGRPARRARVWRLTGPRLDAVTGVSLAGAEVSHGSCDWEPKKIETAKLNGSSFTTVVPRGSAALLFIDT